MSFSTNQSSLNYPKPNNNNNQYNNSNQTSNYQLPSAPRILKRNRPIHEVETTPRPAKVFKRDFWMRDVLQSLPSPESSITLGLIELDHKLDHAIKHRQSTLQQSLLKSQSQSLSSSYLYTPFSQTSIKTIRLYIWNTFEIENKLIDENSAIAQQQQQQQQQIQQQVGQDELPINPVIPPITPTETIGKWKFCIQGTVLEPSSSSSHSSSSSSSSSNQNEYKFSDCFDRVVVELDNKIYPTLNQIEWRKQDWQSVTKSNGMDGFQFEREGNLECKVRIQFFPSSYRNQFRVLNPLSTLLAVEKSTKTNLLNLLWNYIHLHELIDSKNPDIINANDSFRKVFDTDKIEISSLSVRITPFLAPLNPVEVYYQIKLSGNPEESENCYDVDIEIDEKPAVTFPTLDKSKEAFLNSELKKSLYQLDKHSKKRDFLVSLSSNPINIIGELISEQTNDSSFQSTSKNVFSNNSLEQEVFYQPWMHDALLKYLTEFKK